MLRRIRRWLWARRQPEPVYRPILRSKQDWEQQYASQKWLRLREIDELARYCIITGYIRHMYANPSILDVGCGEGVWLDSFRPNPYARYLGIDLSEAAIRTASAKQDDRTAFITADALTFRASEVFDVVILNECLYYFDEPMSVVAQYEAMLRPNGLVIVSMHDNERARLIWQRILQERTLLESTTVTNAAGTSWRVSCWRVGVSP